MMNNGILIVDDSAFMRMMLKDILKGAEITIAGEAENGEDGVAKFLALSPDAVILDLSMPGTDGMKALDEIKKINADAKVIICSSIGHGNIVKESIGLGADAYIVKPFRADRVIDTVKKVINQR